MASFRTVCEAMRRPGQDFWDRGKDDSSEIDEKSMSVILRGLEIRPDRTEGNTFWDDFISVFTNNSDGASKLLGIKPEVISGWAGKIREGVKRAREETAASDERADMIQTGAD